MLTMSSYGFYYFWFIAILAVVWSPSHVIASIRFCSKENDFIGVSTNCAKFMRCSNGRLHEFWCAPGTLFDFKKKQCDFPKNVVCLTSVNLKSSLFSLGSSKGQNKNNSKLFMNGHQYDSKRAFVKKLFANQRMTHKQESTLLLSDASFDDKKKTTTSTKRNSLLELSLKSMKEMNETDTTVTTTFKNVIEIYENITNETKYTKPSISDEFITKRIELKDIISEKNKISNLNLNTTSFKQIASTKFHMSTNKISLNELSITNTSLKPTTSYTPKKNDTSSTFEYLTSTLISSWPKNEILTNFSLTKKNSSQFNLLRNLTFNSSRTIVSTTQNPANQASKNNIITISSKNTNGVSLSSAQTTKTSSYIFKTLSTTSQSNTINITRIFTNDRETISATTKNISDKDASPKNKTSINTATLKPITFISRVNTSPFIIKISETASKINISTGITKKINIIGSPTTISINAGSSKASNGTFKTFSSTSTINYITSKTRISNKFLKTTEAITTKLKQFTVNNLLKTLTAIKTLQNSNLSATSKFPPPVKNSLEKKPSVNTINSYGKLSSVKANLRQVTTSYNVKKRQQTNLATTKPKLNKQLKINSEIVPKSTTKIFPRTQYSKMATLMSKQQISPRKSSLLSTSKSNNIKLIDLKTPTVTEKNKVILKKNLEIENDMDYDDTTNPPAYIVDYRSANVKKLNFMENHSQFMKLNFTTTTSNNRVKNNNLDIKTLEKLKHKINEFANSNDTLTDAIFKGIKTMLMPSSFSSSSSSWDHFSFHLIALNFIYIFFI